MAKVSYSQGGINVYIEREKGEEELPLSDLVRRNTSKIGVPLKNGNVYVATPQVMAEEEKLQTQGEREEYASALDEANRKIAERRAAREKARAEAEAKAASEAEVAAEAPAKAVKPKGKKAAE